MYKPYIYLEARVLLSSVPGVFLGQAEDNGKKDILTAKAEFLKNNNKTNRYDSVSLQPSAIHKVSVFVHAVGASIVDAAVLEKITGKIQEPPDDRGFTGFSVKVAYNGTFSFMFHHKEKLVPLDEIRIEEDRGRLTRSGGKKPLMDWTYAGCPVMRVRTSAVFETGEECEAFLEEFYTLLSYLKLISPERGESAIRCNAYIGVATYPSVPDFYVKLRNLNSFNFVRKAINSECTRQESLLYSGVEVKKESRLWIEEQNATLSYKERNTSVPRFTVLDIPVYIPPLFAAVTPDVELPFVRRERLRREYGLSSLRSKFICKEKDRADYFEQAVDFGADAMMTAHWMAGELMKILNKSNLSIGMSRITSAKFAQVISLLQDGTINSSIAKEMLSRIQETGANVDDLLKESNMSVISSADELVPVIKACMEEHQKSVAAIKRGELAPIEHLTGAVMKATGNRADPLIVKKLIKELLDVSVIYVLTMGGSITAKKMNDGTICAGDEKFVATLLGETNLPIQIVNISSTLSEEIEPKDWASLACEISSCMQSGIANGIVVTHGTDTLPYTAALLFWLFSASKVPVVLTASSSIPYNGTEAVENFEMAVRTAKEKDGGVYVVYGKEILSPLNLKYINSTNSGFVSWNLQKPLFKSENMVSSSYLSVMQPDKIVMKEILNEASSRLFVLSLHPGLFLRQIEGILSDESPVDTVILELYGKGTGNLTGSDYSIKDFLQRGRKYSVNFYCTSQQECTIDLSEFSSSIGVRMGGVVPMGALTTESTIALYFAASLVADSQAEFSQLMESAQDILFV